MIPEYLQEMTAGEILDTVRLKAYHESFSIEQYVMALEKMLLLAIKDALCACDDFSDGSIPATKNTEERAIAFLNHILPYEGKDENIHRDRSE